MSVNVVVVWGPGFSREQFDEIELTLEGAEPEQVEYVYVEIGQGEMPDKIHEKVVAAVQGNENTVNVFAIEDDDVITDWVEDTCVGDWRDLGVSLSTTKGYHVGYLEESLEEDADE